MSLPELVHSSAPAREGAPPFPALVLLHGLGSNEQDLLQLAPYLDPRLLSVSVRAPFSYRWGGFMWFDFERDGPGLGSRSIERSLDALRGMLASLPAELQIDPSRIYLGGFSQGAAIAGALSLLEPERVAGTIMASGFLPPDPASRYHGPVNGRLPIFQAHGTLDPVVPLVAAYQTRDYLRRFNVDLSYREYPMGHEVSPEELRDLRAWFTHLLDAGETKSPVSPPA